MSLSLSRIWIRRAGVAGSGSGGICVIFSVSVGSESSSASMSTGESDSGVVVVVVVVLVPDTKSEVECGVCGGVETALDDEDWLDIERAGGRSGERTGREGGGGVEGSAEELLLVVVVVAAVNSGEGLVCTRCERGGWGGSGGALGLSALELEAEVTLAEVEED